MTDKEAIEMMERCKHELIFLRQQINLLRPKAEAYDNINKILQLVPNQSSPMTEDFVWFLEKRINEIKEHVES